MATLPMKTSVPWGQRVSEGLAVMLVVAVLGWAYAPSFVNLVEQWNADPNNTYGYLVIPIALVILWERRGLFDRSKLAPSWWGFVPLAAVLGLRVLLFEWNEKYIEAATIPLVLAALALVLGGRHLVGVCLPALVFLLFLLPLPPSVNGLLAAPLQQVATLGSLALLQALGLAVFAEGNVIIVGSHPLEVARACNGLSMLLSFVTLITAAVLLVRRPLWERGLLLISTIPIALISNILRITVTAWSYHTLGYETTLIHDWAGIGMMVVALVLLYLELRLLSWLFVEVEEEPARLFPSASAPRRAPRAPADP